MEHFEGKFSAKDSTELFLQGWVPEQPKAVVALVHGQGEHTGRYAHVGQAFARAGYAIVGFDLRGHGRSGGIRTYSPSYEVLLDDVEQFLAEVGRRYPESTLFLYGHSLGGGIVINFLLRRKPRLPGAVATGPWLKLAFEPPPFQIVLGKVMNALYPGFRQKSGLEISALSRDEDVCEAYRRDPLVDGTITARHFFGVRDAGLWALDHAGDLELPLLLMHGTADRITSEPASRSFAESAGDKVTYRTWEGCYHELHNEPEKAEVLQTMLEWIDGRLRR